MSLAITLVVALIVLLLLFIGAWRDLRHGILAIVATLFGAAVSGFWGERWGNEIAAQLDTGPVPVVVMISGLLLTSIALLIGYGGGVLLPPSPKVLTWQQRLLGGALGLLNGMILVGYLLRLGARDNPGFATFVGASIAGQLLYNGLPLLLLAIAIIGGITIIGKSTLIALRKRSITSSRSTGTDKTPSASSANTSLPSSAEQREHQQRDLEKINNRLQ